MWELGTTHSEGRSDRDSWESVSREYSSSEYAELALVITKFTLTLLKAGVEKVKGARSNALYRRPKAGGTLELDVPRFKLSSTDTVVNYE
jgi:hypothetical protein